MQEVRGFDSHRLHQIAAVQRLDGTLGSGVAAVEVLVDEGELFVVFVGEVFVGEGR